MRLKYDFLYLLIRLIIGIIFIWAAIGKIINPASFAAAIDNYRILPYFFVTVAAVVLPWLELFCGLAFITGKFKNGALLILSGLAVVFLVAVTSALIRGLDITCGCFSVNSESTRISYRKLVENIVLLLSLTGLYLKFTREQ